jgi:hypothetical protein
MKVPLTSASLPASVPGLARGRRCRGWRGGRGRCVGAGAGARVGGAGVGGDGAGMKSELTDHEGRIRSLEHPW